MWSQTFYHWLLLLRLCDLFDTVSSDKHHRRQSLSDLPDCVSHCSESRIENSLEACESTTDSSCFCTNSTALGLTEDCYATNCSGVDAQVGQDFLRSLCAQARIKVDLNSSPTRPTMLVPTPLPVSNTEKTSLGRTSAITEQKKLLPPSSSTTVVSSVRAPSTVSKSFDRNFIA
ncbi:hypothetical protein CROQUDRAFT_106418 [Cronartium quercuum f. sp. fusiforme G11]|uniref:CFEM domain-containing protein n=1 Tax=Cronartium quercuum f. sp. fusiforme G11 TaxID=708437 RepID=A0A9P6TDA4_9BASI|nr:hypothetical protein CROQUDRAFT_106418 [Cronartium quercuum f. sp. fusiforme G11]